VRSRSELLAHGITGLAIMAAVAILAIDFATDPALVTAGARDPGPGFLPRIVLILLGTSGLWLAARGFWGLCRDDRTEGPHTRQLAVAEARRMLVPAAMIATLVGVVWLAPAAGFLPVAIVYTVGWALVIAWRDRDLGPSPGYLLAGLGSLLFTIAIYALFKGVIGVPI